MARSLLVSLVAASLLGLAASQSAVLGIDFGSQFMKVALVKPSNPFQIITNVQSKRKTPTSIAFYEKQRLFAGDAEGIFARKPDNVFIGASRLLGKGIDHPVTQHVMAQTRYFGMSIDANHRGGVNVSIPIDAATAEEFGVDGDRLMLTAEEYSAQLFGYISMFSDKFAGVAIKDCVITVPSYADQVRAAASAAARRDSILPSLLCSALLPFCHCHDWSGGAGSPH